MGKGTSTTVACSKSSVSVRIVHEDTSTYRSRALILRIPHVRCRRLSFDAKLIQECLEGSRHRLSSLVTTEDPGRAEESASAKGREVSRPVERMLLSKVALHGKWQGGGDVNKLSLVDSHCDGIEHLRTHLQCDFVLRVALSS